MNKKTIYYDLSLNFAKSNKIYHGGRFFSLWLFKGLTEKNKDFNIIPILPNVIPIQTDEEQISNDSQAIRINDYNELLLKDNTTLIMPMVGAYKDLKSIKKTNPNIRIISFIHGLRSIDINYKLSFREFRFYYGKSGINFYDFIKYNSANVLRYMRVFRSKNLFKKNIKYADFILTVSNYSLQKIIDIAPNVKAKIFIQGIYHNPSKEDNNPLIKNKIEYAFFLSANRPIKNFFNALKGFIIYKKIHKADLKLFVTGLEKLSNYQLSFFKDIEREIIVKDVVFLGYLSSEELSIHILNCKFLIYSSYNEGYGLPPIEFALHSKPSIMSHQTSIPELMGYDGIYFNPKSSNSISEAIFKVNDDKNYQLLCDRINKIKNRFLKENNNDLKEFLVDLNNDFASF